MRSPSPRAQDQCPSWCVVDHLDEVGSAVLHHVARGRVVPVLCFLGCAPETGEEQVESQELVIVRHRYGAGRPTWIYLGDGSQQYLELSEESLRLLVGVLASCAGE